MSDFYHPGGNYMVQFNRGIYTMIKIVKGREISRFINGSWSLEGFSFEINHLHSKFALDLLESRCLGHINNYHLDIIVRKYIIHLHYFNNRASES